MQLFCNTEVGNESVGEEPRKSRNSGFTLIVFNLLTIFSKVGNQLNKR